MKRRIQTYGGNSGFLKLRLSELQAEKLKKIAKRIAPPGVSPTLTMAMRYLIEKEIL